MDSTEKIKKVFEDDVFATKTVGIVIEEASMGYARCSMDVEERHLNVNGVVMGGAIFTLADFAFAVAANGDGDSRAVSLSSTIEFLKPAKGKRLIAETNQLRSGRSTCVFDISITDETGLLVAKATGVGMKTNR